MEGFFNRLSANLLTNLRNPPDGNSGGAPNPNPVPPQPDASFGRPAILRPDDVGFFNPNAEGDGPVVGEKYVIFRDVFVFVDRLKEMKKQFSKD